MAVYGRKLLQDQVVLHRGRDFQCKVDSVDKRGNPVEFPAGELFFELATGGEHNARGHFDISGANGGNYTLSQDGHDSNALPFDTSLNVIKQEIEAFPGVGAGNVAVTGSFIPQWIFSISWSGAMSLSAGVVELFNATVHAAFMALDFMTGGLGVYLDGYYETHAFTLTLTYQGSLLEQELINFAAGVIASIIGAINAALSAVEHFSGEIADISAIYAPLRHIEYEFVNGKALTPMLPLSVTSALTGHEPSIVLTTDAPGRAEFTIWPFEIDGAEATIKVESEQSDQIEARTRWQLVFMPTGEPAGGDPVAMGRVEVQG